MSDIRAAQNGDSAAWRRLFSTYRPAMEVWADSFCANNEMSQNDLVQEAWMQIFRGLGSFRGVHAQDPGEVPPMFFQWLRVTARNAMISRVKSAQAARRSPSHPVVEFHNLAVADDRARTASSIVGGQEQYDKLQDAIAALPELLDRQLITMCFQDNLSLRSVASMLGQDYSKIRRRWHSLMKQLASTLESE